MNVENEGKAWAPLETGSLSSLPMGVEATGTSSPHLIPITRFFSCQSKMVKPNAISRSSNVTRCKPNAGSNNKKEANSTQPTARDELRASFTSMGMALNFLRSCAKRPT